MTWDPYDRPHALGDRHDHQLPERQPLSGRAVAAVLGGMALLALVFNIAANAQDTTTQTEEGAAGQQEQQEQTDATGSLQAAPDAQPAEEAAAEATARALDGQIVEQPEGTYAASELIGESVISAEGENMGKIADLLVTEDNRIAGVMIGIGGFLGFGEKRIAVELDRLALAPTAEGGEQLMLNFTRAELEQAPEFVSLDEQRQQQEAEQARKMLEQTQQPATGEQSGASQSLTQ